MKKKLLSRDLTDAEINQLRIAAGEDNLLEVIDPEHLMDVYFPDGVSLKNIVMYPMQHVFALEYKEARLSMKLLGNADSANTAFSTERAKTSANQEIIAIETEDDRNARVVYCKNNAVASKEVVYEIQNNERTLYVEEFYILDRFGTANTERLAISETTPKSVKVFGEDDGYVWYLRISDPTSRPSVEWLSSFGLKPYVEK